MGSSGSRAHGDASGAPPEHMIRAVAAPERVVACDLDRLIDEGLGVFVTDGAASFSDRVGWPLCFVR